MQTIDLHAHTTASDGSLTPTQLMVLSAEEGLTAIAVTDHDTIDGLSEATGAAAALNIELVPGIELGLDYPHGRFHLLGLLIDPQCEVLAGRLVRLKENRRQRNARMLAKMQELGLPITLEDVQRASGGGQLGRPHIALAMVGKGIVSSVAEAFALYLADGKPAHVPKDKIPPQEGIDLIHAAGGLAIMAHPNSLKLNHHDLSSDLQELRAIGLDGIECYYSQHSPARTAELLQIAAAVGLLVSGGSDFHGDPKPDIRIGQVDDGRPAPNALLYALKEAKAVVRAERKR